MNRVLVLLAASAAALYANPEITVELPGDTTMDFVWIEPGRLSMGSDPAERWDSPNKNPFANESPARVVTLTRGFWLGKYEVTQGQWEAVVGTTPWSGRGRLIENPDCPALFISWADSQELCAHLNAAEELPMYRLPTEAEWEYACRAGTTTLWHFGNDETQLSAYDWTQENTRDAGMVYAQPVGLLRPNPWGLYDMHGNVSEWVQDWYGPYDSDAATDPMGPEGGERRIQRGGNFYAFFRYARSAARVPEVDSGSYWAGVRLVREGETPGTPVVPATWGTIKRGVSSR